MMTPGKQKRKESPEEEQDETTSRGPKFKVPRKSPNKEKEVDDSEDMQIKVIQETRARLKEKEETLRKLRLVKMYRTKWEMQGLDTVTNEWLRACQEALVDLREKVREKRAQETGGEELTLKTLMDNLGIDTELLQLDEDEDSFTK